MGNLTQRQHICRISSSNIEPLMGSKVITVRSGIGKFDAKDYDSDFFDKVYSLHRSENLRSQERSLLKSSWAFVPVFLFARTIHGVAPTTLATTGAKGGITWLDSDSEYDSDDSDIDARALMDFLTKYKKQEEEDSEVSDESEEDSEDDETGGLFWNNGSESDSDSEEEEEANCKFNVDRNGSQEDAGCKLFGDSSDEEE